jgi:hypothetical protein
VQSGYHLHHAIMREGYQDYDNAQSLTSYGKYNLFWRLDQGIV